MVVGGLREGVNKKIDFLGDMAHQPSSSPPLCCHRGGGGLTFYIEQNDLNVTLQKEDLKKKIG